MPKVDLKEKWRRTPHCPGVYLMKGEGGGVIYVGKAKDLPGGWRINFRHLA